MGVTVIAEKCHFARLIDDSSRSTIQNATAANYCTLAAEIAEGIIGIGT